MPIPKSPSSLIGNPQLMPTVLGTLRVNPKHHPRGQPHLSAASGLVRLGKRLFVVADDELHLGIFDDFTEANAAPREGALLRLLDGKLPNKMEKRKKAKPDLETLALLPPLLGFEAGALLALGSGSKPQRQTGVLIALDELGTPSGSMATIDLTALYAPLRSEFADLNIEGAFLSHDHSEFILLQRGNKTDARSACIRYDWLALAAWLAGHQSAPPAAKSVQIITLGSVDGIPLSFTDGAALPENHPSNHADSHAYSHSGAWVFSAVAEATNDSVQDGACVASAVGIISQEGAVITIALLQNAPKIEGIAVKAAGKDWLLTMVTDPDNPELAAQVLQVLLKAS